jgi:aminomethyltransferase
MHPEIEKLSAEYQAIRTGCGLVDHAGTGVLRVTGTGATAFISRICSRSADFLLEGQVLPALILDDEGTLLAEVLVLCEEDGFRIEVWPDLADAARGRLVSAAVDEPQVVVEDLSAGTRVLAVEGPKAPGIAQQFLPFPTSTMAYPSFVAVQWQGIPLLISRTGVSGEYGFKFHIAVEQAGKLTAALQESGAVPVGRAALDVCRMEVRFANLERESGPGPLTPFAVGLQWMVDFGHDFLGRDALLQRRESEDTTRLVCWQAGDDGSDVPEPGTPLTIEGNTVGRVRHAVFSPGLSRVIGVADVESDLAASGLDMAIGEQAQPVRTISSPFLVATSLSVPIE